ncbi:hypothetical protein PC116_g1186 [Phytophthora cactorum]|nr:hypothetical protein PC116_g1186 [Phytophthora cactorum]
MVGSANLSQNAMKRNIEDIWLLSGDIIDRYKLTFTRRWSNIAVPFSKRFIVKRNEETGRSKVPQLCSAVSDYFPGARTHGFSFTEFLLSGPNNDSSPSFPDLETPGSTPAPDLIPASTPVSTPAPAPTTAPASASTTTPASILAENQHDENLCRVDGCNARVQIRGRCLDVTAKEPRRSARVRGVCYTHGAKKNCRNEGCATPTRFAATLRKMYVQQANEKVMVKKELELLDHYKLVCVCGGGGLIKQDWDVTMSNVNKHLELIENEL